MLNLFSLCNIFQDSLNQIVNLWESTGIYALFGGDATWQNLVMLLISLYSKTSDPVEATMYKNSENLTIFW